MRRVVLPCLLTLLALPAAGSAQTWSTAADQSGCDDDRGGDRERWCEVREATLQATGRLEVDGGRNGGVRVRGWDRPEVRVLARVFAHDRRDAERAREVADRVTLSSDGGRLVADGPSTGRGTSWGVSWEVWAPRETALELRASNGGIAMEGLRGAVRFETLNGGVHIQDMAGDVRGETRNGGLRVELTGARWQGEGLAVETQNGGVDLRVPDDYSAELVTGTVNGGMEIDFPVMVRGRLDRRITATLGDGGPTVRVETRNGSVRVRRR